MASSTRFAVPARVNVVQWLRTRDAGLSALRRACRAAIVMPAVFAIAELRIGNPTVAIFAAFGAVAMLLFVDFGGSMRERLVAQASLMLTGVIMICIGTLASQVGWLAVATTLVVAFAVLFAGIVSSVLASATTALLVSFILPVTLPGPVSSIPHRLFGWLLAGAASLVAIATLWPAPTREQLRRSTAEACTLLARRLGAEVDCVRDGFEPDRTAALGALADEAATAVAALRTSFYGTPYRPTGLTTATRTLVRLIDQVVWLEALLQRTPVVQQPGPNDAVVCEVKLAAAALLESDAGGPHELDPDLRRLQEAREAMERTVTAALPVRRARTTAPDAPGSGVAEFVSSLEPSFRAEERPPAHRNAARSRHGDARCRRAGVAAPPRRPRGPAASARARAVRRARRRRPRR